MIRTVIQPAIAAFAVAALVALAGCGGPGPSAEKTPSAESGHYEGDGHDHGAEEAGHVEGEVEDHAAEAAAEHPMEGPNGGHLIELGHEEYHAELLHDDDTNTVTVNLLDAAGKQPVAIPEQEIVLQLFQGGQFASYSLKAAHDAADVAGAASRFQLVDAGLSDALEHEEGLRGRLQVTIDGKPFVGQLEHTSHADHAGEDGEHAPPDQ